MSEASAEKGIALTLTADDRDLFARARRDPYFVGALAIALAAHLLLFLEYRPKARVIGDPSGARDPIAVSIITSDELKQRSQQSAESSSPPPQPPPAPPVKDASPEPAPPPEPPPPQAEAETPAQPAPVPPPLAEPPPQPAASEAPKHAAPEPVLDQPAPEGLVAPSPKTEAAKEEAKPEEPSEAKPEAKTTEATPETKVPEPMPEKPKPPEPQKVRKPEAAKTPPKQKSAALDLRMPPPSPNSFSGKRAGVERPPGITRSGENDAFAMGVIRALQATMPQMSTVGRVTVRITLDMNGNIARTEIVRPSQDPILDQSVVFATKQSNFPLPPLNAKPQDLVFVVTYNYTVR